MAAKPNKPDFRNMTLQEIRKNISDLNETIKKLNEEESIVQNELLAGQTFILAVTIPAALIFPPLALSGIFAGAAHGAGKTRQGMEIIEERREVKALRAKFKTVWRARPGRKQYDLTARREREAARKKQPKL